MDPQAALARWGSSDPVRELTGGLINHTWTVGKPPWAVLQWVNPIFDPQIHLDVEAFTSRLEDAGLMTPRLVPTGDGELWSNRGGCWRLLTYIPGTTLHRFETVEQAAEAGRLVGRFHAALAGWDYRLQACQRLHVHDTTAHMAELHAARSQYPRHPLADEVREVASEILGRWADWEGELEPHHRFSHGDLKASNLRFDAAGEQALCLIDLDTLGTMPIGCEMGDAWRSWCNRASENQPEASSFDLELFAASARAWLAAAPPLTDPERRSLVPSIERICLELAARFCTDAVRNTYFREDRETYPEPGRHNLIRARGQLALAVSAREERAECEKIVESAIKG